MLKTISLFILLANSIQADDYASLLFHGNCTTCHFEKKSISAPSVIELKKHYISAFSDKDDFVTNLSLWVLHPKKETSIMQEAITEHGLMPELGYDLETLKIISKYIYETDFTKEHTLHK